MAAGRFWVFNSPTSVPRMGVDLATPDGKILLQAKSKCLISLGRILPLFTEKMADFGGCSQLGKLLLYH